MTLVTLVLSLVLLSVVSAGCLYDLPSLEEENGDPAEPDGSSWAEISEVLSFNLIYMTPPTGVGSGWNLDPPEGYEIRDLDVQVSWEPESALSEKLKVELGTWENDRLIIQYTFEGTSPLMIRVTEALPHASFDVLLSKPLGFAKDLDVAFEGTVQFGPAAEA